MHNQPFLLVLRKGVVKSLVCAVMLSFPVAALGGPVADGWSPAKGSLMTRWASEVTPGNVHPEYPRPQMVRDEWMNLNGLWDYAITPKADGRPEKWDGKILVPFCVESALSGVMKTVGRESRIWYRRSFKAPATYRGKRLLLHFGAVDWDTTVWVNGAEAAKHRGGYDPFTIDITEAVAKAGDRACEVVLSVYDPTKGGTQPRGKQTDNPGGIWYTPVTGIWQTVWLEPVPKEAYIRSLKIVPDVDKGVVRITVDVPGAAPASKIVLILYREAGDLKLDGASGKPNEEVVVPVKNPRLWSPDDPHLYDLKVVLVDGTATPRDSVGTYFAMRKIAIAKDARGINRLFLNGKPLFQYGPLDQGWWPDGLYTAPTDEALRYDIEVTRKLGMNMIRKHVKVEPDRWYYHCDKLGMLVWQDMPNGDKHAGKGFAKGITRTPESARQYDLEWTRIMTAFGNHPCIVMWVPFNESWGQFDTPRVTEMTRKLDPTRLVNSSSGWSDHGTGDVQDIHRYPGPGMAKLEEKRAVVLGEFGGLGLPIEGHLWWDKKNWGYRSFTSRKELTAGYLDLITKLKPLVSQGLAAAIYTQTTDVEGEVNGLMTYDRAMIKMNVEELRKAHQGLYAPVSKP
ncbi:MAG: beta-galactosidase [Phycisphaerae bacterium]|nr:beta-galactosidase [Phycisphaerae bacterium]